MQSRTLIVVLVLWTGVGSARIFGKEQSIAGRMAGRDFPSVFQAWGRADNVKGRDALTVTARHDLIWHGVEWFGLVWDQQPSGVAAAFNPESLQRGREKRKTLLKLNPNIILIAEIRYRDASRHFLPADHRWWRRDNGGKLTKGWAEGGFIQLDFDNPEFREHVARRAKAVIESGVVDGVLLDWWSDDDSRLELIKKVRKAIGDDHLLIANANDRTTPRTAPYINGYFMECYRSHTPKDWQRIAATLKWAEQNLRPPRVNCLETWFHHSRMDLNLMRAVTTLSLTHSNGYCLFSDPNPLPTGDHRHNWYPFWNKTLGTPLSAGVIAVDGTVRREFENGCAVYNPMGNGAVEIVFDVVRTSVATGETAQSHLLKSPDGDIYLR